MKKLFVLVFAIALCLGVLCVGASAVEYNQNGFGGDGSYEPATQQNGVYQIGNAGQLYWFAQQVNGGSTGISAVLTKDITINTGVLNAVASDSTPANTWTPMGTSKDYAYTGTFDGGNHTISGLYYSGSGKYVGLFGYVGSGGQVKNVNIADSYISNSYSGSSDSAYVGGVCGCNSGTVTNCSVSDSVFSGNNGDPMAGEFAHVGGVCGWNYGGTITNCSNKGSVNSDGYVGGVCGRNYDGTISNCYNTGNVTGATAGGLCVINDGTIWNCYNTGNVTGTTAGGLCGVNYSTITNCYNTGNVSGEDNFGGVCGYNYNGTITNCYNIGSVTGSGNGSIYAGGVCGNNDSFRHQSTITNCYNTGSVTGSENVGGVCGYNGDYSTIDNCYNTGNVSGGGNNDNVGGVCGYNNRGTITNCYWREVTGLNGCGIDEGTVTDVEYKTAEEFASGEVTWLLNSDQENGPWRQTLDEDDYPVLDNNHKEVVKLTVDEDDVSYHNKGYSFSGETNKTYFKADVAIELPYTVYEDTELTSAAIYTVTVVYDNGTAEKTEQVVDGDTFPLPAAPSKSGYTFVGWSDGTNTYDPGDSVPITGNVTFTAVWQAINIPDPNGITVTQPENGTVKVNPSNGSAGTLITVTATPDEGYELAYITVDGEKITGNTFRMPDKAVTVTAVFVPIEFPFTDVKSGDWFYDYVAYVYANGLMDGTSATTFEPNANMTRAMVWAILARIDGETVTGAAWATDARTWAMAEGVSDGTDPNGLVTREQFATMLYRYAVAKGYDVSIGESTNILSYADFASISEYAIPAMQWACGSGIVTGVTDSTLAPQGTATRAQCAAMLMRFVEL